MAALWAQKGHEVFICEQELLYSISGDDWDPLEFGWICPAAESRLPLFYESRVLEDGEDAAPIHFGCSGWKASLFDPSAVAVREGRVLSKVVRTVHHPDFLRSDEWMDVCCEASKTNPEMLQIVPLERNDWWVRMQRKNRKENA